MKNFSYFFRVAIKLRFQLRHNPLRQTFPGELDAKMKSGDAMREIATYEELLSALLELSPEQLKQPIQLAEPTGNLDEPVELKPGIAIGTVAEMEFYGSRSVVDNKYHADEVVILIDGNPFAKDGAVAYSLSDADGDIDDLDKHPIYGNCGPTDASEQMAPPMDRAYEDMPAATIAFLKWTSTTGNRYKKL